jgi:hypothetical protein
MASDCRSRLAVIRFSTQFLLFENSLWACHINITPRSWVDDNIRAEFSSPFYSVLSADSVRTLRAWCDARRNSNTRTGSLDQQRRHGIESHAVVVGTLELPQPCRL